MAISANLSTLLDTVIPDPSAATEFKTYLNGSATVTFTNKTLTTPTITNPTVTTGTFATPALTTPTVATSLTLNDACDIVVNTATGSKIGTATGQKIAFHNSTPVIQRAGSAQAAVTTTAATSTTPFGFAQAQADAIITLVNELRAAAVEKGLIKGAA